MREKLHLLHVFPSFGVGGAEIRMTSIMNSLGPSILHTVLALNGNFTAVERVKQPVELRTVPPPPGLGSPLYPLKLRGAIRAVRPDALLTYNWGAMDAVIGASIGPLCPVIHNECGFGADEATRLKRRRVLTRRIVLNRIYKTVVVSTTALNLALNCFKLRPGKVQFIRTGVDEERFQLRRNHAWREHHGIPDGAVLFGYVGGLRVEKNVPLLVRAFAEARLPNAWLALIGDGPCRRELERLRAELGLGDRVIFEGQVADTAPCLAAFDVFALSSLTEQTPNALLEAMACGLPAVTTRVGDVPEILGACPGPDPVAPNDLGAYVEAMRVMAAQPELRAAAGAANRRRAVAHYSLERMSREYAALYHAATGSGLAETALAPRS